MAMIRTSYGIEGLIRVVGYSFTALDWNQRPYTGRPAEHGRSK